MILREFQYNNMKYADNIVLMVDTERIMQKKTPKET